MKHYMEILKRMSALLFISLLMGACGSSTGTGNDSSGTDTTLQAEGTTVTTSNSKNEPSGQKQGNSLLSNVQTSAPAKDVAASQDALFIAEGDHGVEIIQIGYNDRIDYELITTITGINATYVTLSEDQTKLYVENKDGYYNVYDIRDIKAPRKEKVLTKGSLQTNPVSTSGVYEYAPKKKAGLYIYDISNPSQKTLVTQYNAIAVYAVVLVDQGTKALTANKEKGLTLLDVSHPDTVTRLSNKQLPGETLGLSVNPDSGLLFVANGDNGIKVFNLNIFLDELR